VARDIRQVGRDPDPPDPETHVEQILACVREFVTELRKYPVVGEYTVVQEWWHRQVSDRDRFTAEVRRAVVGDRPTPPEGAAREAHDAAFDVAYQLADLWFRGEVSEAAVDLLLYGEGLYLAPRYLDALLGRLEDDLRRAENPLASADSSVAEPSGAATISLHVAPPAQPVPDGPFEKDGRLYFGWEGFPHPVNPDLRQAWAVLREMCPPVDGTERPVAEVKSAIGSKAKFDRFGAKLVSQVRRILSQVQTGFDFVCTVNQEKIEVFRWRRVG
jgi:hypothetical protein